MTELAQQVVRRFVAAQRPNLRDVLLELENLEDLSSTLTEIEERFDQHFASRTAALDPEVTSQLDALNKAREGVRAAENLKKQVEAILQQYPDDKTAKRSAADADTMLKRFQKHEQAAHKIIRTISKKALPKALKALAPKVASLIRAKLVDPKMLQVIPWQREMPSIRGEAGGIEYQVVFRIVEPRLKARGWGHDKAEIITAENTASYKGVSMITPAPHREDNPSAKEVAEAFLNQLQGWPGMKGEAEATESRAGTARAIASALEGLGRKLRSYDDDRVTVSKDNRRVSTAYRSDLPKEGESAVGEYEYGRMVDAEYKRALPTIKRVLDPWENKIEKWDLSYGEKGWGYISVTLK